ncbi:MAG: hypothetical protein JNK11_12840 [Alphaproteobacteria bacterium]|nr:hypothetical protein [Alphaproteobacteria bacterium]
MDQSRRRLLLGSAACAASLVVASCGLTKTTGTAEVRHSNKAALPRGTLALVRVRAPGQAQDVLDTVRSLVATSFTHAGYIRELVGEGEPCELFVDVELTKVELIPDMARYLAGVLAPRNTIAGTVTVYESQSGGWQRLREITAEGRGAVSFQGGQSGVFNAAEEFAQRAVAALHGG